MLVQVGFQKSFGVAGMESVPQRGSVWLSFVCLAVSHTLQRCGTESTLLGRPYSAVTFTLTLRFSFDLPLNTPLVGGTSA